MSDVGAPRPLSRVTVSVIWALAAAFNAAFVAFFTLYTEADDWAVDRSESTGAFDPSQLLPHDAALWVVAHAALGLLVLLDGVGIALWVRCFRAGRSGRAPGRVER
ncbi:MULTISPECIES: hypothetical protein [unclassified Curtobacterium]|uniref:hypothetical protein n=1 Tax=unclassified Curtobacterium TaxID=257496 RepID=UPI0039B07A15